jgi:hypothetical protein
MISLLCICCTKLLLNINMSVPSSNFGTDGLRKTLNENRATNGHK